MAFSAAQSKRLNFRLDPGIKHVIERAAAIRGQSLTDFAISTLEREARSVVSAYEVLTLSDRDRDAFLAALDNPPAPNANLRRAAKRYQQVTKAGHVR